MSCIEQLAEEDKINLFSSIFSENYFLWIGSGFSYNFGFGSWEDVLIKISETIEYPLKLDVKNPLKAAELLCSFAIHHLKYDEYKFNSLVADVLLELKKDDVKPDWIRRFRAFSPKTIVTTNWDDQLETIFDNLVNVVVRKGKSPQVSNKGRNIFKIHGDVGRPESIVVTQSQYFSFQREDTYLNRKIYTLFSEASPIFLGYSLTDPNVSFLYDEVYAHLGEEKPPAYMVVHPSVEDSVLEESKLLFQDKNIHIIKAEIGEFLEDLSTEYRKYKKSSKRFFVEHENIESRLRQIVTLIIDKKKITNEKILEIFSNQDSRRQAVSAFVELMSKQFLYTEFGGELLAPENRMSYREINQLIQTIICMTNDCGYPDFETKEKFHKSVMTLCAESDGVWDFYSARKPFMNILRVSPGVESDVFEDRIDHIVNVLRWSGPNQLGKCWATWNEFRDKINWFSESDIDEIIAELGTSGRFSFRESDIQWVEKLKDSKHCSEIQIKRINDLIEI
ncbi:SIR2 family protein [Vibrio tasmaniensis]|nr:SIR2 family protein [Vibrio tasmaniensis]